MYTHYPYEVVEPTHKLTKGEIDNKLQLHEAILRMMKTTPTTKREKVEWGPLKQSMHSKNTVNPIRKIADAMSVPPNPNKKVINLNLGDPSLSEKLPPSKVAIEAITEAVTSSKANGYGPAVGSLAARQAVVKRYSTPQARFTADDVVLASGCSHALQMAIEALCDPGDNILIPNPGFPLYSTLCRPHGVEDRAYNLDLKNGALIDLEHLTSLIDDRTKAIIINNPGNPTGAVLPKMHLQHVLQIAQKYRVVIIADEIYGDLTYDGAEFYPLASLSPKVPIITCDGIAKRWMVPGWRLGWIIIHDRFSVLSEVRKGIVALSQKIVGPCSIVQGALPKILENTPAEYFKNSGKVISDNARIFVDALRDMPGLHVLKPSGAMYMMVSIDRAIYGEEITFVQDLIREESVFVLPGSAFSAPGWFRLVLTWSAEEMKEAAARVRSFCERRVNKYLESEHTDSSDEGCDISNSESE